MAKKKSNKKLIIALSFTGVLIIAIVAAVLLTGGPKPIEVQISKAERRTITQTVTATGKIEAETEVKVSSETSGEIVELPIKEGDTVRSGALLARIKPDIIESQLEQSTAAAEGSQKQIEMQRASRDRAAAEFKRVAELFAKKYASQSEYDAAKAAIDQAEAQLSATEFGYKQSKAMLKQTQHSASRTVLRAPMNGVVTKLNVEKGDKVVGTNMMAGTEMMKVSDLSVMNATVEVDENDIVMVKIGDTSAVYIDALPDQVFNGVVVEMGHSALVGSTGTQDQVTNFKVKIRILDTDAKLRPGMSCNVEIRTKKVENALAVPLLAVTTRDAEEKELKPGESAGPKDAPKDNPDEPKNVKAEKEKELKKKREKTRSVVFVKDGDKVKLTEVKTGISDKGYIEILEGLNEGDEVVSGSYVAVGKQLKDGSMIKVDSMKKSKFGSGK